MGPIILLSFWEFFWFSFAFFSVLAAVTVVVKYFEYKVVEPDPKNHSFKEYFLKNWYKCNLWF